MRPLTIPYLLLCLLLAFFFSAAAYGAEKPVAQAGGEVGFARANQKAIAKLKKMTPSQIRALDKKLAAALKLYYDGEYKKALPRLQAIAREVETLDLMFWIGNAAAKLKKFALAETQYRKMLAVDPKLHRVRLELAMVLFHTGRLAESKKELETVGKSNPPREVRGNIDRMLGKIESRNRRLSFSGRASLGVMWDSNVSFGPALKEYEVPGGTLTPSTATAEKGDWAYLANFQASLAYDLGKPQEWLFVAGLALYDRVYLQESAFNYQLADLTAGPMWVGKRTVFKMPFGYTERYYSNERLSGTGRVEPSLQYYFSPEFSLKGGYTFSHEVYDTSAFSGLNNNTHTLEISPALHFFKRSHTLSLIAGWDLHQADLERYSYEGPYLALSYYANFATDTELYLRYQWTKRNYRGVEPLFAVGRDDRRHSVLAVVSQKIYTYYFASLALNLVQNESSVGIYDVERATVTLTLGMLF